MVVVSDEEEQIQSEEFEDPVEDPVPDPAPAPKKRQSKKNGRKKLMKVSTDETEEPVDAAENSKPKKVNKVRKKKTKKPATAERQKSDPLSNDTGDIQVEPLTKGKNVDPEYKDINDTELDVDVKTKGNKKAKIPKKDMTQADGTVSNEPEQKDQQVPPFATERHDDLSNNH